MQKKQIKNCALLFAIVYQNYKYVKIQTCTSGNHSNTLPVIFTQTDSFEKQSRSSLTLGGGGQNLLFHTHNKLLFIMKKLHLLNTTATFSINSNFKVFIFELVNIFHTLKYEIN